jgi:ubiquinone/menaquinone biosynthesis C-methylase UbiE
MAGTLTDAEIKARVASSYNQIAHRYLHWSTPHRNDSTSFLQQYIIPHLNSVSGSYATREQAQVIPQNPGVIIKQGVAALELGCGAGIPTTQLLASVRNIHVTANDISPKQISLTRENLVGSSHTGSSISLIEGDMMTLSFPRSNFDAVVAMYSIFHLPRPEQSVMLSKISTWLKPEGLLLCCFPSEELEQLVEADWLEKGAWMFWSSWGKRKSLEMVRDAGLEVIMEQVVGDEGGDEDNAEAEGEAKPTFLWVVARKRGAKTEGQEVNSS